MKAKKMLLCSLMALMPMTMTSCSMKPEDATKAMEEIVSHHADIANAPRQINVTHSYSLAGSETWYYDADAEYYREALTVIILFIPIVNYDYYYKSPVDGNYYHYKETEGKQKAYSKLDAESMASALESKKAVAWGKLEQPIAKAKEVVDAYAAGQAKKVTIARGFDKTLKVKGTISHTETTESLDDQPSETYTVTEEVEVKFNADKLPTSFKVTSTSTKEDSSKSTTKWSYNYEKKDDLPYPNKETTPTSSEVAPSVPEASPAQPEGSPSEPEGSPSVPEGPGA